MARLPDRYSLSGPVSLRSGREISSADTSAIGRGISAIGGAMAQIAAKQKQQDTALGIARANAYQDQQNIDLVNGFDSDPDFGTFGARADEKAREIASTAAEFIPDPEARELWKAQADTTAKATADNIGDRGVGLKRQADVGLLDETLEVQRRIYVDPNSTEEQKAAARAKVEGTLEVSKGAGLLLPDEYDTRKKFYLEDADYSRAKLDTTLSDPREAYYAAIRQAESGGNDAAKNPKSSATGRYQFTQGTWDGLVEAYPNAGLTKDGRTDPAQQERAIRLFTAQNEAALAKAGIAGTNGNLYAAHFLGAEGAADVLRADDGAALTDLLPAEVISANPFLKGMTVAGFKSWAAEKGGGSGGVPAYIERLSPEQRQVVYDMRAAEANQAATAAQAQARVDYANLDGSIGLGILTGDIVSEQQIFEAGLDAADTAKHIRSFRSEYDASAEARSFLAGLSDGTARDVNPYSTDDRALVDKSYDMLTKVVSEDQRDAATTEFVRETGIVPKAVVASVRQSLNATDPATVAAGMARAAQIYDMAPQSLDAMDNGPELRTAALTYDELVNGRGLSDMQAAQEVMRLRDPKEKLRAETLDAAWKQAVKDNAFPVQDVTSGFDTSWMPGAPSAGLTPLQEQGVTADYLAAAERAFRGDAQGDTALAKKIALDEMKRTYGVSQTSGQQVVMKYPPEAFYPVIDGSQDYLRDFALKDARTIDPAATDVMVVSTPETAQDVKAGQPPRYNLFIKNADGMWDVSPGLWGVDGADIAALQNVVSETRRLTLGGDEAAITDLVMQKDELLGKDSGPAEYVPPAIPPQPFREASPLTPGSASPL